MKPSPGVSFVVPVHNGRRWLPAVLDAIDAQCDGRPFEVIVVDDGSSDGSGRWLRERAKKGGLTLVDGPRRGAAAAVNAGIRVARHPIICQVDQDVIVQSGWLAELVAALENPEVGAAQGCYVPAADARFWARVMGRDLEWRYSRLQDGFTDHICTGNSAYRASALHGVGLLDETLGYGYDNDLSYRLRAAGHRLVFCRNAVSVHRWRENAIGYLRQQFGFGYGRLDVVWKHPMRAGGDTVSTSLMMAHAPLTLVAVALLAAGGLFAAGGVAFGGALILTALAAERSVVGIATWRLTRDPAALAFPIAHFGRNGAWALAILFWCARRATGRQTLPAHSMSRSAAPGPAFQMANLRPGQLLAVVPAYNESGNLLRVIRELKRLSAAVDVLVVNDGSTDETPEMLPNLGVRWLTMATRVGVGGAVRAGLRYAVERRYEYVVRIDGDGQHRVADIGRLLEPVAAGRLETVIGSRFMARRRRRPTLLRSAQAMLAACMSAATRTRITDPTSGFCVFGKQALQLLARHHPTGYAEPELILLLHRNRLRFGEVPIRTRPRLEGRSSLTPGRALVAIGRTVLALLVVPAGRLAADSGNP
jgi:glycosyltransferase involved in cell wall biosynthesis